MAMMARATARPMRNKWCAEAKCLNVGVLKCAECEREEHEHYFCLKHRPHEIHAKKEEIK